MISTSGGDVLLPDVPAFVKRKDPESGILVTPIPGFFDGAAENVAGEKEGKK